MRYLGKMHELRWNSTPQKLIVGRDIMLDEEGRPTGMPVFPEGIFLFGVIDQGLGENVFLCESTDDIQTLLSSHSEWFSGHLPDSSYAYKWTSKTGKFTPTEMHLLEVYNVVALKRIMLLHFPIEAMRALAELMLHDDPRLGELLADAELTAHWKDWAFGANGYEPKDCEYVVLLDRRQPAL